jgi:hypothetical protein
MPGKDAMAAVLAALGLCTPAVAGAQPSYSSEPQTRAVQVATQFWGRALPCPAGVNFSFEASAPSVVIAGPGQAGLGSGALAVSAWTTAVDPTCTVHLNRAFWSPGSLRGEFHLFCDTVTHEVGHWLGHEDGGQSDPASITYPTLDESSPNYDAVPGCVHHGYGH